MRQGQGNQPNKFLTHSFRARQHGSKLACEWCGATEGDPIHKPPFGRPANYRGQALVEFALILPIFLLLQMGMFLIGLLLLMRMELTQAASEGAIAGAMNPGDSCGVAITSARKVYRGSLDSETCTANGQILTLTLRDTLNLPLPFLGDSWPVTVTQRAVLR